MTMIVEQGNIATNDTIKIPYSTAEKLGRDYQKSF